MMSSQELDIIIYVLEIRHSFYIFTVRFGCFFRGEVLKLILFLGSTLIEILCMLQQNKLCLVKAKTFFI